MSLCRVRDRERRITLHADHGLTLVELMVVVLLLGVVGAVALTGVLAGFRTAAHAEARIQALTAGQRTLENVGREIRAADSRDVNGATLLEARPDRIRFDVLRDGRRVRHTVWVTDSRLSHRREIWNQAAPVPSTPPDSSITRVLIDGVVNTAPDPVFSYRRRDGSCITGCVVAGTYSGAAISSTALPSVGDVTITVHGSVGAGRSPIELVTRITLRNT